MIHFVGIAASLSICRTVAPEIYVLIGIAFPEIFLISR